MASFHKDVLRLILAFSTVIPVTTAIANLSDPCYNYTELDEPWRVTNNTYASDRKYDDPIIWSGWYRLFINNVSAHIPDKCVARYSCGTDVALWIRGGHPTVMDGVVTRDVCGHDGGSTYCCYYGSYPIKVKACPDNYYVYELVSPALYYSAYCADTGSITTSSTAVTPVTISPDPCYNYNILDDPRRSINNTRGLHSYFLCDWYVSWSGWYRLFINGLSAQIPDTCVEVDSCGTNFPLWIRGGHPTVMDGVVSRDVCGHASRYCCIFGSFPIKVKACPGNYYVYELVSPTVCDSAYCAVVTNISSTDTTVTPEMTSADVTINSSTHTTIIPEMTAAVTKISSTDTTVTPEMTSAVTSQPDTSTTSTSPTSTVPFQPVTSTTSTSSTSTVPLNPVTSITSTSSPSTELVATTAPTSPITTVFLQPVTSTTSTSSTSTDHLLTVTSTTSTSLTTEVPLQSVTSTTSTSSTSTVPLQPVFSTTSTSSTSTDDLEHVGTTEPTRPTPTVFFQPVTSTTSTSSTSTGYIQPVTSTAPTSPSTTVPLHPVTSTTSTSPTSTVALQPITSMTFPSYAFTDKLLTVTPTTSTSSTSTDHLLTVTSTTSTSLTTEVPLQSVTSTTSTSSTSTVFFQPVTSTTSTSSTSTVLLQPVTSTTSTSSTGHLLTITSTASTSPSSTVPLQPVTPSTSTSPTTAVSLQPVTSTTTTSSTSTVYLQPVTSTTSTSSTTSVPLQPVTSTTSSSSTSTDNLLTVTSTSSNSPTTAVSLLPVTSTTSTSPTSTVPLQSFTSTTSSSTSTVYLQPVTSSTSTSPITTVPLQPVTSTSSTSSISTGYLLAISSTMSTSPTTSVTSQHVTSTTSTSSTSIVPLPPVTSITSTSHTSAGLVITLMEDCRSQTTGRCVENLLDRIENITTNVLPLTDVKTILDMVLNASEKVLESSSADPNKLVSDGNRVLKASEKLVSMLVMQTNTTANVSFTLDNVEVEIFMVGPNTTLEKIPRLDTTNSSVDIDLIGIAKNNIETRSAVVAFMSYNTMENLLKPDFFNTSGDQVKTMMSTVISVTLPKTTNTKLTKPVNFTLKHIREFDPSGSLSCVYWNISEWIVDGCSVLKTNSSYTVCSCVHLSTFALIMQTSRPPENDPLLDLLNLVCVIVGLVFFSLALLTFALCQWSPGVNNVARINICISLLLAHLLFLLTQQFLSFIRPHQVLCAVISGVLHFLFLSGFMWMFIEAVLLFICVKNLSQISSINREVLSSGFLCVIGYMVALVVVAMSAVVGPKGYGSEMCWIKIDKGFIWSFLGPVCMILTSNTILFIKIVIILNSTLRNLNAEVSQMKQTKIMVFKTLAQFVVLGCSWILGFFTNGRKELEIIFLILNSQQGTFIFLIYCVLNKEIRQQYRKFFRCLCCGLKKTLRIKAS